MAKIGDIRSFGGKKFTLVRKDISTKVEAQRAASWSGKYSCVRIEKMGRGDYRLWVGPDKRQARY